MIIEILKAIAIIAAISLVAGILLALASHFFGIAEDEKVKLIRACLPNLNCGACGFKGCDDYAQHLAQGKTKPNLCIPGAESTAQEIAKILNCDAGEHIDYVAFVHCNGNKFATSKKSVFQGPQSCKAASMVYGGPNSCIYGCLGYGDCAAVCPSNAICVKDGIAHVDTSLCVGCGLCAKTCPKHIISMVPQDTKVVVMCSSKDKGAEARKVCKNACIGCKKCEKTCPHGAITVKDNLATIDYEKCTNCEECVKVCPTGCIKSVFFPDIEEA